ncbi:aldo/keto reductase [bacterium]|nr:aldo/keto reductase [bacterium]
MKKLGFGLMRLPLKEGFTGAHLASPDIDLELLKEIIDIFLTEGFSYFDTAFPYHQGCSETALRELAVRRRPRESFTVTDKLPCWEIASPDDFSPIFKLQLERCGVDYFDYYFLHSLDAVSCARMEKLGGFEFLQSLKREGKIKHIGFSFHDGAEVLDAILSRHPEVEYVQLQINYLDWENPLVQSRRCYEVCCRHGRPVIVMEPVKGGSLASLPAEAAGILRELNPELTPAGWALRFAASLPNVFMVLSGMNTLAQIKENVKTFDSLEPLSAKELEALKRAAAVVSRHIVIPCTSCHYCTDGCPAHICIPEYFALCNSIYNLSAYQELLERGFGMASECIGCGQCEARCPQHIPIIEHLKKVVDIFES